MTASREAESEVGLVLVFTLGVAQCVGRQHAILLVAESPGVEWRELDCGRGVRE